MQCGWCAAELSRAEVVRHVQHAHDFEAFERKLMAGVPPITADEDLQIPDVIAPASDALTTGMDGEMLVPAAWSQPMCDRCWVHECLFNTLYGYDGYTAATLMRFYQEGSHSCPQSPVMAYCWAHVLCWWERSTVLDEGIVSDDYRQVRALLKTLRRQLSAEEHRAALALAREVFEIALLNGALWQIHLRSRLSY